MGVLVTNDPDNERLEDRYGLLPRLVGVINGAQHIRAYGACSDWLPDLAESVEGTTTYDIELPRAAGCKCEIHVTIDGDVDVYGNARWPPALSGLLCYVGAATEGKLAAAICASPAVKTVNTGSLDVPVGVTTPAGAGAQTVVRVSRGPIRRSDTLACNTTSDKCRLRFDVKASGNLNAATGTPLTCRGTWASSELQIGHSVHVAAYHCADATDRFFEWSSEEGYLFQSEADSAFEAERRELLGVRGAEPLDPAGAAAVERFAAGMETALNEPRSDGLNAAVKDAFRQEFLARLDHGAVDGKDLAARWAAFESELSKLDAPSPESPCAPDGDAAVIRRVRKAFDLEG